MVTAIRSLFFFYSLLLHGGVMICSIDVLPSDCTLGFALDFYHAIRTVQKNHNLIFSPVSISLGLGMLELGTKGTTLQQLRKGLHFDETQEGREFSAMKKLLKIISSYGEENKLNLASAIYVQDNYQLNEQYLLNNQDIFNSSVRELNFQDTMSAARNINAWVTRQTHGKVKDLFSSESFSSLTRLVLVNAIYFKGTWKHRFSQDNTSVTQFTKSDGSIIHIPIMHQQVKCKLGYFTADEVSYQVLELPYSGDESSMILALPAKGTDLTELEKLITPRIVENWLSTITEEDVEIYLPRFKTQQKLDLKAPLRALNITEIFKTGGDLSGISDSPDLHISEAVHQAFIELNEEGSEAAASTGMTLAVMSLPRHQFIATRPFLFIVRNNLAGSILFVGRILDPEMPNGSARDTESL